MLLCICVAAWCFCKTKLTQLHFYCKVCESFEDIIQPTRGIWVKRKTYESNPKFNNLDLLPTLLATLWMSLLQFGRPKDLEFISSELLTSVRWFCFSRILDKKKSHCLRWSFRKSWHQSLFFSGLSREIVRTRIFTPIATLFNVACRFSCLFLISLSRHRSFSLSFLGFLGTESGREYLWASKIFFLKFFINI